MDDSALHRDEAVPRDGVAGQDERELARSSVGRPLPHRRRRSDRDAVDCGDGAGRSRTENELDRPALSWTRVATAGLVFDVGAVQMEFVARVASGGIGRRRRSSVAPLHRCVSSLRRFARGCGRFLGGGGVCRRRLDPWVVRVGCCIALGTSKRDAGHHASDQHRGKSTGPDVHHRSRRLPRVRAVSGRPDSASGQPDSASGPPDTRDAQGSGKAGSAMGTGIAPWRTR